MFDVLVQIYETYGYTSREAVASIVEHNIYGLDIDERAAQLANFAIMMKARQYDRRFFSRRIQPKVYAIAEGNGIDRFALDYFINGDAKLKEAIDSIVKEMHDAKEYGSILNITPVDFEALYVRFEEVKNDIHMSKDVVLEDILPLVQVAKILSQKYDVCITNPPYMGSGGMSSKLDKYVKENFTDSKSDMFAVFIEKCMQMIKRNGYQAMITQHSWMFLSSYERLRSQIVNSKCISSMLHLGTKAFDPGEVGTIVQTTSFVLQNTHLYYYKGQYRRLVDFGNSEEKEKAVINKTKDIEYATSAEQIAPVPNNIIAYWLPRTVVDAFKEKKIGDYSDTKKGILSGKNDIFVRYWFEPSIDKIGLECSSHDDMIASRKKWFPITSGGFRKKWYGNQDNVVNMENDGFAIKSYPNNNYRLRESSYYCREGYSWSEVAGNYFSVRYVPQGITFGNGGPMGFAANHLKYIIGFLNTVVANDFLMLLAPTLNFGPEQIRQIPLIIGNEGDINELVSENISIAKVDWDSFENSWEFKKHPLINRENYLSNAFKNWSLHCEKRFEKLKFNEIEYFALWIPSIHS